jgi:hypothetical protein
MLKSGPMPSSNTIDTREFEFTPELINQLRADPIARQFESLGKQQRPPNKAPDSPTLHTDQT